MVPILIVALHKSRFLLTKKNLMKGQFVVPILLVLDISLPLLPKLWRLIVALHKSRFLQKKPNEQSI
jgi:hypothetical protein